MLDLVLEKSPRFLHANLKRCKANIELKANTATGDDPSNAIALDGVFRIMNTGSGSDCVITAQGNTGETAITVTAPSEIKVTLKADATMKVAFAEGELKTDTGIVWEKEDGTADDAPAAASLKPAGLTAAVEQDLDEEGNPMGPHTLRLTRAGEAATAKACRMDVTFLGAKVATGCGRDRNCNGPFTINPVGEIHADAVCGWDRVHDLKPNPTHFRIRGVNSHAKVYTLGVADNTHTANTSGE